MKLWVPLILGSCLVGSAAPAAAQFTAAVVPPPQPAQPAAAVATHVDTVKRAQTAAAKTLTGMKAWVDSAALALAQEPATQPDTTARSAAAATAGTPGAGAQSDTSTRRTNVATGEVGHFRNGARAPATATPLPLLALLGVASLIAGALLRRRPS